MTANNIFDYETALPDKGLSQGESNLLGFESRYNRIYGQLQLLFRIDEIENWSKIHYGKKIVPLCKLISDQYPLVIFYGDVGTGKTATAECIANRLVKDTRTEDSILFKLSNRVRGSGRVGEMGTLLTEAFKKIVSSAGKSRRAILIIDEADSLAASRNQENSHHEDKVAVNTLIQNIDELKKLSGRVVIILCTNRLSIVDSALKRRASIVEEFTRPSTDEIFQLLSMDLAGIGITDEELESLAKSLSGSPKHPAWTYSDIRSRLYPAVLAQSFPDKPISFGILSELARKMKPTPIMEDK